MLHRTKFVESFYPRWQRWCDAPDLGTADTRSRKVHGVGYAGFMAMVELLEGATVQGVTQAIVEPRKLDEFRRDMVTHTALAVRDVRANVKVNTIWSYIITAFKRGEFRGVFRQMFKVEKVGPPGTPPGALDQTAELLSDWRAAWESRVLYMDYGAVFAQLEDYIRKSGGSLPITLKDMRDQMKAQKYFIPGEHRRKMRPNATSGQYCWAIALDYHPQGYLPVPTAELLASRKGVESTEWLDPRKGEMFLLVDELEKKTDAGGPGMSARGES